MLHACGEVKSFRWWCYQHMHF